MPAEAGPGILAFTSFPDAHWKQVWSNNPLERLNKATVLSEPAALRDYPAQVQDTRSIKTLGATRRLCQWILPL